MKAKIAIANKEPAMAIHYSFFKGEFHTLPARIIFRQGILTHFKLPDDLAEVALMNDMIQDRFPGIAKYLLFHLRPEGCSIRIVAEPFLSGIVDFHFLSNYG